MKYFIKDKDRKGTCYYEFYKGKWDGESFWKTDSILLHDDIVFQNEEFIDAILKVVPSYNPFGEIEISNVEWKAIGQFIELKSTTVREIYFEADEWLQEVFTEYDCFTILGI